MPFKGEKENALSLLVLVSSEDLTITSVLQKCLNVFPRPLCIFFFFQKT